MEMFQVSGSLLPFPSLPPALVRKFEISELAFRPFGIEESDLAVDFSRKNLPGLITDILKQCSVSRNGALPKDFFLDLSIGKRLECLLFLVSGNRKAFSFPFKCESCGLMMELELTLAEIAELQKESDLREEIGVEIENQKFVFRKPLGRDQESWQSQTFPGEETARQTIIGSLQIAPPATKEISSEAFAIIDEAMSEADPLINFFFRTRCSECETLYDFPVDLGEFALGELNRAQKFLLWTTHRFASHYHWSEKEIFAVPHWRRMQYLELITGKK